MAKYAASGGIFSNLLTANLLENQAHTHTHTRLTALFPGLPRWAGTRKGKSIWILLKLETVSGSGINWAHMQVCTSLQADNHASTPPLSFLQAGCPSCHPTNSVKALKALENQAMKEFVKMG